MIGSIWLDTTWHHVRWRADSAASGVHWWTRDQKRAASRAKNAGVGGAPRQSTGRPTRRASASASRRSTRRSPICANCCPPFHPTRSSPRSKSCGWPFATSATSITCWPRDNFGSRFESCSLFLAIFRFPNACWFLSSLFINRQLSGNQLFSSHGLGWTKLLRVMIISDLGTWLQRFMQHIYVSYLRYPLSKRVLIWSFKEPSYVAYETRSILSNIWTASYQKVTS